MDYTIHGTTIFIKGNGIISQYILWAKGSDKVNKIMGNGRISFFHTIGTLATNTEADLLNELRLEGKI